MLPEDGLQEMDCKKCRLTASLLTCLTWPSMHFTVDQHVSCFASLKSHSGPFVFSVRFLQGVSRAQNQPIWGAVLGFELWLSWGLPVRILEPLAPLEEKPRN